jgi:hypothetical protein
MNDRQKQIVADVRKELGNQSSEFTVALGSVIAEQTARNCFKPEAFERDRPNLVVEAMGIFLSRVFNHPDPVTRACAAALEDQNQHDEAAYLRD